MSAEASSSSGQTGMNGLNLGWDRKYTVLLSVLIWTGLVWADTNSSRYLVVFGFALLCLVGLVVFDTKRRGKRERVWSGKS